MIKEKHLSACSTTRSGKSNNGYKNYRPIVELWFGTCSSGSHRYQPQCYTGEKRCYPFAVTSEMSHANSVLFFRECFRELKARSTQHGLFEETEVLNMSEESTKYWNNDYKMAKRYGLHINTAVLNISGSHFKISKISKFSKNIPEDHG